MNTATPRGMMLLAAGYRKSPKPALMSADFLYQKRVVDDLGETKYFINFYEYLPTKNLGLGYQSEIDIDIGGDRHVNVTAGTWCGYATLAEVEQFFESAFMALTTQQTMKLEGKRRTVKKANRGGHKCL